MTKTISTVNLPLEAGKNLSWTGLSGAKLPIATCEASQAHQGLTLVIAANTAAANQLAQELSFFSSPGCDIALFNDWETLPYDHFSPHQDIISERLKILQGLPSSTHGIVIIAASTLLQRLSPSSYIEAHSLVIENGSNLDVEQLRTRFIRCGYQQVSQVLQHGEYAVRGSILDIFPMGSKNPFRIDLFDQQIDSIRIFDPESQRSLDKVQNIELLPAREFPLDDESISKFRQAWRERFNVNPANCSMYQDISNGTASNGIEYYLPLFFETTECFLDYLPQNTLVITLTDLPGRLQQHWQEIDQRFQQLCYDTSRPLLKPVEAFFSPEIIQEKLSGFKLLQNTEAEYTQTYLINSKSKTPYSELQNFVNNTDKRILFTAETLGRRENLLQQLLPLKIKPESFDTWLDYLNSNQPYGLCVAKLATGCELDHVVIISESQLTGQAPQEHRQTATNSFDASSLIRNLTELSIGEAIVHIEHGVGRFLGLQLINEAEFLTIEYAERNKLYVPVTSLHLISRYGSVNPDSIVLNRLGTDHWEKSREKAAKRAYDVAVELLELNAQRAIKPGFKFSAPDLHYQHFANNFPFELTADQVQTIDQIITDMTTDYAMDRLVCGDVGFGKTEVAMRAAFIAIQSHKQVAVLVPTTLLAQQHYETFKDRFADTGANIAVLSRFNTPKEQQQALDNLAAGKVDIIIGTHKLIQNDIKFDNLGLLIIDEEHRFGVRQKERIKALRAEIDILTLTATPIPRTLNMALSDVRDLSIIGTPPAKRLSVKTFVHQHDGPVIREAVLREIMRGGQVFYLHNTVKTMEQCARELRELLPEAKINTAHGQMPENQLENVMADFYHQRFNVLVCTTIIENGIDIPTANTIVIERADKLGLAQLHQLRGRVGRSHHQAYAYLLTPDKNLLTSDAEKRLDAISSLEELGIGFSLATHDLEIRGAGEFLGDEQSGHIQNIGFSLYMEFLERAIASLKSGKKIDFGASLLHSTEIDLNIPTLIPESYLPDVHTRLILYKRIANAKTELDLRNLQVEMIDRFGLLPDSVKNLFLVTELKLQAEALGIHKISIYKQYGYIDFNKQLEIDPIIIIKLIQKQPEQYKMDGAQRLRMTLDPEKPVQQQINSLFLKLQNHA